MLPETHYKQYGKVTKKGDFMDEMIELFVGVGNVPQGFSEDITKMWLSEVVESGRRLPLPHNLGNVQVLEHLYEGEDVSHMAKFGNLDYSLIWRKHPMYKRMKITIDEVFNDKAREARLNGKIFLNSYVDGDALI